MIVSYLSFHLLVVGGCDFSNALRPNVNYTMIIKLVGRKTVRVFGQEKSPHPLLLLGIIFTTRPGIKLNLAVFLSVLVFNNKRKLLKLLGQVEGTFQMKMRYFYCGPLCRFI